MNGAQALIRALVDSGVEVCFMNPGTSEMHFVAALDDVPEMRGVLALFEGVATGAADGYARMADRPAAVLLHLGPGLGNGLANLHNARRAKSPVVNVVGDHATHHKQFDAQLESDIPTVARNVSQWIRASVSPSEVGLDALDAVSAAYGPPGQVATLLLPADVSWADGASPVAATPPSPAWTGPDPETITAIADAIRSGDGVAFLLGGRACRERALVAASRLGLHTGARLICETFPARLERGAGLPALERLAYLAEFATKQLAGVQHLVLVDAKRPVSFFAYPDKPSDLVPDGCAVHDLAPAPVDAALALEALAAALGVGEETSVQQPQRPPLPAGPITARGVADVLGHLLPEDSIVSDEGNTAGIYFAGATAGAARHDWLCLTGGAIGQGLPVALGAAIASPGRRVFALQADGSSLYTLQAWWTMARERLDVTTILLNNRSYSVLNMELDRVGAVAGGPKARAMLDLSDPDIDFVAIASGFGIPANRAESCEHLAQLLSASIEHPGPAVIECVLT